MENCVARLVAVELSMPYFPAVLISGGQKDVVRDKFERTISVWIVGVFYSLCTVFLCTRG
jgi:hypothetical protein